MHQKVGLITGCGKGIGFSIAKKLLEENEKITLLGISRTENSEIQKLQESYKERFIFQECDISDYKKFNSILENTIIKKGNLSFAICNAGIRSRFSVEESELNLYRSIIEINTIANINISKKVIENCLKDKINCNILFISSIVGARGFDELTTYAVSKSALEGFMRSAAVEYAKHNIQINCLAPGFVKSSYSDNFKKNKKELYDWTIAQTPMGRWGDCDEIAELALFLISPKNSYMTGTVIYCDGGWTAK